MQTPTLAELKKTVFSKKLNVQSRTEQLMDGVVSGIKKTKAQRAFELYGDDSLKSRIKVSGIMNRLRKHGVMVFSKKDPVTNQHHLIYVNNNPKEFASCIEDYTNQNVVNHLENVFFFMEKLIDLFPSSHKFIETHAQKLITMVLNKQKHLLGIPYGNEHKPVTQNRV